MDASHKIINSWNNHLKDTLKTDFNSEELHKLIASIISVGPFYSYVIDFFDMSLSNVVGEVESIHGIDKSNLTLDQVFSHIHPDDVAFVSSAEKKLGDYFYNELKPEELLNYKLSYNFRMKMKDGSYKLVNHQALVLTLDDKKNFSRSLNIHTVIDHITTENNRTITLIGFNGRKSIFNISVDSSTLTAINVRYSSREIEVISEFAKGSSYKEIGNKLNISPETVKSHRKNILLKAEVKTIREVIVRCIKMGIIT